MKKDRIQKYLKSLNPKDKNLIYGCLYHLYKDGNFIGDGIWVKDVNIGDSFQMKGINQQGEEVIIVLIPDSWSIVN